MKVKKRILLQLILLVSFCALGLFFLHRFIVRADTFQLGQADCGRDLQDPGTYELYENMTCGYGSDGFALKIKSDNIILDGKNFSLSGMASAEVGIRLYESGHIFQNIIIKNFSKISGFTTAGVDCSNCQNSLIENVTANSNKYGLAFDYSIANRILDSDMSSNQIGIYLHGIGQPNSCYSNILSGNTANFNDEYGIYLLECQASKLTGNTANSNKDNGILLSSSPQTTMRSNAMSGNAGGNFIVSGTDDAAYESNIDVTNIVENKPIYYFYNQKDQNYDSQVLGEIGMFWCIGCTNITVANAILSANNYYGVYFRNTSNSQIQNMNASNSVYGINLFSSSNNTLIDNTANSNQADGILLSSSANNNLTSNTTHSNNYGIYMVFSSADTLEQNTINSNGNGLYLVSSSATPTANIIFGNENDIYDNGTNTYSDNQFLYNGKNKMLTFPEIVRAKNLNEDINFAANIYTLAGSECDQSTCQVSAQISPGNSQAIEEIAVSRSGKDLSGNFSGLRTGTYSLILTVTDAHNNVTKRNYLFFVNADGLETTKYYLRGINPTHGQTSHSDSKSLLLTPPTETESWTHNSRIQSSPDEIPSYPLAYLADIKIDQWYKITTLGYIGLQRYGTHGATVDLNPQAEEVPEAVKYTWISKNFTAVNWAMDFPYSWYWLALKLKGATNTNPSWTTFPASAADADPSSWNTHHNQTGQADSSETEFTYKYTTTPIVKSISNSDKIIVLSATAPVGDPDNATVVLDGTGSADIVLENYKKPFLDHQTVVNADGTTTLTAQEITSETTINSAKMDITPNVGKVKIKIETWNTSGDYSKKWTEEGTDGATSALHTIGDLKPDTYYTISTDGWSYTDKTDTQGILPAFNYDHGYSAHTFVLASDTTAPTISVDSPADGSTTVDSTIQVKGQVSDSESGVASLTINGGSVASPNQFSQTVSLNLGANAIALIATDKAGNSNSKTLTVNREASAPTPTSSGPVPLSPIPSAVIPSVPGTEKPISWFGLPPLGVSLLILIIVSAIVSVILWIRSLRRKRQGLK